jgi:hypothetical protein
MESLAFVNGLLIDKPESFYFFMANAPLFPRNKQNR